ncbi:MAG: NADH-quinone oxidoreductase subunit L [Deltaproteobacteria bacterium]|nr:NADH-quinone oxidoreductase subunit L [Deltaproteobacteria bacterium]
MAALLIVLPLLGVVLLNLPLPRRWTNGVALSFAGVFCALEVVAAFANNIAAWFGVMSYWSLDLSFAAGSGKGLSGLLGAKFADVDDLTRVMFLAISLVGLCAVWVARYSLGPDAEKRFRFANLLLLILAGMNGIVLVRDLFALYVFLEITAVTSFVLIALERGKQALEGAFKYMVLSAVATALLLAGIALLFIITGDTSFAAARSALAGGAGASKVGLAAVALFLAGLSIKAGLVPFHGWLPDAYASAPAAVSVLLAGIVTKVSGVYTLIRLAEVFGYSAPLKTTMLIAGAFSIVAGALAALAQKDFKRMLAYSSISQVGYIILALGVAGPDTVGQVAIAGAVLHLFNHAIFKTLLFVNSAAVEQQAGTLDMDQLGGISVKMPVTGTTSVLAMLSTAGIPPLSGFWSKLLIVFAVWKAGHQGWAALAVVSSLITLAYFLSMQRRVFFGKLSASCAGLKEAGGWGLLPALMLAAITVLLGLGAPWLFGTFLLKVGSIL